MSKQDELIATLKKRYPLFEYKPYNNQMIQVTVKKGGSSMYITKLDDDTIERLNYEHKNQVK